MMAYDYDVISKCPSCNSDFEIERFTTALVTELSSGEDTYTSSWTAECANGHRIDVRGKIRTASRVAFMVVVPEVIKTATKMMGPCIACQFPIEPGQQYFMQVQKHVRC